MVSRLHAEVASVQVDHRGETVVGFYETSGGSGSSLELQLASSFDEQDRASGMDTYCIVVNGGPTAYGGVEAQSLSAGRLDLVLDADAAAALGLEEVVEIAFPGDATETVRAGLARIWAHL